MPYVDLVSTDDYASIWYTTNSFTKYVSSFDADKPTVMMLHPMGFDSRWLTTQLADPRLNDNYNVIAIDSRYAGRSHSRPSGKLDHWVEAADLAFICQSLQLPSVHVWAEEPLATNVALRFAILFPEMCLSLTLVTVAPPTELKSYFASFDEMMNMWSFAEDLDTFEHAVMEFFGLTVGSDIEDDMSDSIVAYWQTNYPPFRRSRFVELANLLMNRVPLQSHMLDAVTQPVLIIHGDKNPLHPVKYAQDLASKLRNAKGGAHVFIMKGCQGYLSLFSTSSSILVQTFTKFLQRLPRVRSDLVRPRKSTETRMAAALETLADLVGNPAIAERNAMSPLSFSMVSLDVETSQCNILKTFHRGQNTAFSPLGPDGRPVRKFSERKMGHWFHSEPDGSSYAAH
ncbi:alpha/beta-hydrolase [Stereum hirsutum FP-91666 SS1]|uniref:alpha/beta-hydrolase n=1 Tax=Stereum hirsutum (strain FP-91666) TaxID=721885 RepID=UPI000440D2A9|nr:alpha/beta-hydrolase [Stereum hirsutum FP-91666 SS1]EIM88148.1 alpha/beta-hydrolase [Stereum hirsutum FP-91666 SS1]